MLDATDKPQSTDGAQPPPQEGQDASGGGAASLEAQLSAAQAELAKLRNIVGDGKNLPDWMQRRIDSEVARRAKVEREKTAMEQELAHLRSELARQGGSASSPSLVGLGGGGQELGSPVGSAVPKPGVLPQDFESAVATEAARRLAAEAAAKAELESQEAGKQAYPDFEPVVSGLRQIGEIPPHFLEIAMQTGQAHHVLYQLGQDLNFAAKVAAMPPGAMAMEMAKLAQGPVAPKRAKTSAAPTPITPVGGKTTPDLSDLADDKLPMEEWLRRRKALAGKK